MIISYIFLALIKIFDNAVLTASKYLKEII